MTALQTNTGHIVSPTELRNRYVVTHTIQIPGNSSSREVGYTQWHVGDQGSVHIDAPLLWTLIEVRITEVLSRSLYRTSITRFDGALTQLASLSIGDELMVDSDQFFTLWGPEQYREQGEGPQKIHDEGSTRMPIMPKPTSDKKWIH